MHPFGMYLAITDRERHHGWSDERRSGITFARVDAPPLPEPEPASVSRVGRAVAMIRQLVVRPARA
jgi:hypothetical protein